MTAFIDAYDAALFDLDGVLYLGPDVIAGGPETVQLLRDRGIRTLFVTNNAARSEEVVAAHLSELGYEATVGDLATSAQATAALLRDRLAAGTKVLVCGTANLVAHVAAVGLCPVASADDDPEAVVMGYDPDLRWPALDEVGFAVQRGAWWVATNPDLTRPTHRGIVPGLGTMIHAITVATGREPDVVVGKPHRPLMAEAVRLSGARRPVFVGDRIDTDVMGAHAVGIDSFMVFTGSHGRAALLAAPPHGRPTAIGWDAAALLRPRRTASVESDAARCGSVVVHLVGGRAVFEGVLDTREAQLDALWALAQLAWAGRVGDPEGSAAGLALLPA